MRHLRSLITACLLLSLTCLLASCGGQADPVSPPPTEELASPAISQEVPQEIPRGDVTPAELAQSVYQSIVGDHTSRDFHMEVSEGEDTTRIHITGENDWNLLNDLSDFEWAYAEPCDCAALLTLTLTSADGETWLRCWEGCDQVMVYAGGEYCLLSAREPEEQNFVLRLFPCLLNAADDALLHQTWADIVIDGSVTDYNEVVKQFSLQRVENLNALPDWVPNKPLEIQYCRSVANQAYFGEGTENFCGSYALYLSPEMGNSDWQAGSGMDQETEGEYAGWWKWISGAYFARNEDGDWICIGMHTGGAQLIFPTPLEEASLEQLVYYFFHTSGGGYHTSSIPSYICRQPASELERLNDILEDYPAEDAREFCLSLGKYLAEYPDRVDVGLNDILSLLTEPCCGWLTEGFSPVTRSTAYDTRVTADEVVLHNGVRLRMTYDEVVAITGYEGEDIPTDPEVRSFICENILYGFSLNDAGEFILTYINIAEEAAQASILRDIKIGDSIESVFSRIPAQDTELKKWAYQTLYGTDASDEAGHAWLEFVAMSYYSMRILTPKYHVNLIFSRDQLCVKWIEINVRS